MVADEPERVHNLDGEQVCRSDSAPMSLEEGAPRHALAPLRSRRDTVLGEEPLDSVASEFMSEVLECAPQAGASAIKCWWPPRNPLAC